MSLAPPTFEELVQIPARRRTCCCCEVPGCCDQHSSIGDVSQELTLGLEVAKHYATLLNLLRGPGSEPVDPHTLVGADLHTVHQLSQVTPSVR